MACAEPGGSAASTRHLFLVATPREAEPLRRALEREAAGGWTIRVTGVGPSAGAAAAALAVERLRPRRVVQVGGAGAYPATGLEIGDVVIASDVVLADEGVETEEGFLDLGQLGLASARRGDERLHNRFPAEAPRPAALAALENEARRGAGFRLRVGRIATVATGSGTPERVLRNQRLWAPLAEAMEGGGAALVAWERGLPFREVRGISNEVGPRDAATWDIETAMRHAARIAVAWSRSDDA